MDVTLPNGVVIRDVPEGTNKWTIAEHAIRSRLAKPEDFGQQSSIPTANAPRPEFSQLTRAVGALVPPAGLAMEALQRFHDRFGPMPTSGRRATISGDLRDFAAGMGKYQTDIALGARQMFGGGTMEEATAKRELDAPLMRTGAGARGNIAGGVVTMLPAAFVPGVNTVAGATALGGVVGALQPTERSGDRLLNTAVGAGLGGATQYAAGRLFKPPAVRSSVPSIDDIKVAKDAAYAAADASDQVVPLDRIGQVVPKVEAMLREEGYRPGLHPATKEALTALYEDSTQPGVYGQTLKGVEGLRRQLLQAELAATNRADARMAGKVLDQFDDVMDEMAPYGDARALYHTLRKAQDIEALFEKARNAAGGYTQSGYENTLRIQFRQLADNPRRFNRFNADEKEAILKVVRGGPVQAFVRFLGKFAPRGPVSAMATGLLGGGPGGALALGALGEGSKAVASNMRVGAANRVSEIIRSQAPIMRPPALPPPQLPWWNTPVVGPRVQPQNFLAPAAAAQTGQVTNYLYGRDRR